MTTTRSEDLTLPVVLAASIPVLLVRLGVVFVRLKAKRRGGVPFWGAPRGRRPLG